jgi:hypothetical protein
MHLFHEWSEWFNEEAYNCQNYQTRFCQVCNKKEFNQLGSCHKWEYKDLTDSDGRIILYNSYFSYPHYENRKYSLRQKKCINCGFSRIEKDQ